jgi:UDP-N-acetylmuramate: L-alanyl-gamma-D-glutamyl-meso-diaminopimelate ligase
VAEDLEALVTGLARALTAGDHALIMSNGGFGGLHARLLSALASLPAADAVASRHGQ